MLRPLRGTSTVAQLTRHRWPRRLPRYSLAGLTGALLFGSAAFTPSLLPRAWYWQGIVDGISAAFGYAVGVLLLWIARRLTSWRPSPDTVRHLWFVFAGAAIPLIGLTLWLGQRWQHQVHVLTGTEPPSSSSWLPILVLSFAVLFVLISVVRALRWLVRLVTSRLVQLVPPAVAAPLAFLLVTLLVVGLTNEVVWRGLVAAADRISASVNDATNDGTTRPLAPERSGSPLSLVPWESLGRQGRDFVARGPTVPELTRFSGERAEEPVRVYVGVESAATTRERADLAVRELRRAGGFQRDVLVVATATGTGVVDPEGVDALEYMYNGDTAFVTMQYSYLPSALALMIGHQKAEIAGRALFDKVYDAWSALPPADRPTLLVTGTSLGVEGSEAGFSGLADLRRRSDGAVWSGPPSFDPWHESFVDGREPASPEWLPIYRDGRVVRFAARPQDLRRPDGPWTRPRVVYLQNGSDPVLLWSPSLLFEKPDWLSGPRAPDVSPDMFWFPFITFWQVTADLPSTYAVTPGHGHHYRELYADAWAAVAPPAGWTAEDTDRLRERLSHIWYE